VPIARAAAVGVPFFLLGFPRLKLMSRLLDSADRKRPPSGDASIKELSSTLDSSSSR
jgi:hypothetical protein